MSRLAAWEAAQAERLRDLRAGAADAPALGDLLLTACLLELAKLGSARADLPTYAQLAVDVLTQFVPLDGCALELDPPGLPPLHVRAGAPDPPEACFDVVVGGEALGRLRVAGVPLGLDPSFLSVVADHLAGALDTVLEAERLRRLVAAGEATRLASAVPDDLAEDDVQALADAVAALPGVVGARLEVREPLLDGLLRGESGVPGSASADGGVRTERDVPEDDPDPMRVVLVWAAPPSPEDQAVVDGVLDVLGHSLALRNVNRRLRADAETDPLTGVGNRRLASRALAGALARARRTDECVAVVALDLDHFKDVNDTFGHGVGDDVLRGVGGALASSVRGEDVVARTGGEEFVVICPTADATAGRAVAERLRRAIADACDGVVPDGRRVTTSVGVAVFPRDGEQGEVLLRVADDALYVAKRSGRDRVVVAGDD